MKSPEFLHKTFSNGVSRFIPIKWNETAPTYQGDNVYSCPYIPGWQCLQLPLHTRVTMFTVAPTSPGWKCLQLPPHTRVIKKKMFTVAPTYKGVNVYSCPYIPGWLFTVAPHTTTRVKMFTAAPTYQGDNAYSCPYIPGWQYLQLPLPTRVTLFTVAPIPVILNQAAPTYQVTLFTLYSWPQIHKQSSRSPEDQWRRTEYKTNTLVTCWPKMTRMCVKDTAVLTCSQYLEQSKCGPRPVRQYPHTVHDESGSDVGWLWVFSLQPLLHTAVCFPLNPWEA